LVTKIQVVMPSPTVIVNLNTTNLSDQ